MKKSLLNISLVALFLLPTGTTQAQTSFRVLPRTIPESYSSVSGPKFHSGFVKASRQVPRRAEESNIVWKNEFDSQEDFDKFTVINSNNDDVTWEWGKTRFAYRYAARTGYSSTNGNDDWLVTPAIHLSKSDVYHLTFKAMNQWEANPNTLEVKYGIAATAEGLNTPVMETATPGGSYAVYSYSITPSADGDYYFGFHDNTSEPNMGRLILDSVVIEKAASLNAPDSVTGLKVLPGAKGALEATVSFSVPARNIDGSTLATVDSIQIQRGGERIGSLPQSAAGALLNFTDSLVPANGTYIYSAIPYVGTKSGLKADASAYIGQDAPTRLHKVELFPNGSNIRVTWNSASTVGANGGYVNPDSVKSVFYKLVDISDGFTTHTSIGDSITESEPGSTTALLPQDPEQVATTGAVQELYCVGVKAVNSLGESGVYPSNSLVIGPSLALPFAESFSHGASDNGFIWTSRNAQALSRSNSSQWSFAVGMASDDDTHSAVWMTTDSRDIQKGDAASINMAKVSLRGAVHPSLVYNIYSTAADSAVFEVNILRPDDVEDTLQTINLADTKIDGWTTHLIDLSSYTNQDYVIVRFWGFSTGSNTLIALDDIKIYDQKPYDLKVTGFTAPLKTTAGTTTPIQVAYQNIGQNPAKDYSIVLYDDDAPVDTVTVSKELPVLDADTVTLNLPVAVNKQYSTADGKTYTSVHASIIWPSDGDLSNNATGVDTITVATSAYQRVTTLSAVADENGNVSLNWTVPAKSEPITETEDFESYLPFSTDLGDWKLVDNSKGVGGYLFYNFTYPLEQKPFAFCAFKPSDMRGSKPATDAWPGLLPHSGNQYAATTNKYDNAGKVNSDEWLISPELPGTSQTIKFYALNWVSTYINFNEKFDVLYSSTGNNPADFKLIESDVADGTAHSDSVANWKEFNVSLPEGAKYFAIHHNSTADNVFLFGIDDVTYTRTAPGTNDSIVGYKLYRDSVLIASTDGKTLTATDNLIDGTYVYNVTVLYKSPEGQISESAFSNDAVISVTTGIDGIKANEENKYNVYTIDGKLILRNSRSITSLTPGLYIINGRKYMIH